MGSHRNRRNLRALGLLFAALGVGCAGPSGKVVAASSDAASQSSSQPSSEQDSMQSAVQALQWPRSFDAPDGTHVELYQPQIDTWRDGRLGGRMAVAAGPQGGSPTYGVVEFSARADVNKPAGLVQLDDFRIEKVQVPTAPQQADKLRSLLIARLPTQAITTQLESLQTSYAVSQQLAAAGSVPVKNAPPRIIFRSVPTALVLIDGKPSLYDVEGQAGWRRVVNTRVLILADNAGNYFVNAAGYWYESHDLSNPWNTVEESPALRNAAEAAERTAKTDPMLPKDGKPALKAPAIVVSTEPAELVLTIGQPEFRPVQGTSLLAVNNADHALFMNPSDNRYYVLLSGRWFRAGQMTGPWTFVSGKQLPKDFARIDVHDPQAGVLASVPGTPQAKEAVIASTIPQMATVNRGKAGLNVDYAGGRAEFQYIPGTTLEYALNTAVPVFRINGGGYYALSQAVWFTSDSATGPWHVADFVPPEIYAIPVNSPYHYVTYVRVYSSTPDTVVFGYTPGYMGVVVAPDGTVVYGTGYVYPSYVAGPTWIGYPPTYGYNAAFDTAAGFAFGFAAAEVWGGAAPYWGPYGGASYWRGVDVNTTDVYGRWGASGTVTHAAGWNGWTGTQWQGSHAEGYNPVTGASFEGTKGSAYNWQTGNSAAGYRGAYSNPTTGVSGAARGGVVENSSGQWAAGQQGVRTNANTGRTTASSTTATGQAGQGANSVDSRGVTHDSKTGNTVGWNNGNVYADHDGNVYQHNDSGWQQHTSSGWQPASSTSTANRQYLSSQQAARSSADSYTSGHYDGSDGGDSSSRYSGSGESSAHYGGGDGGGWGQRSFNGSGSHGWGGGGGWGGGDRSYGGGGGGFRGGFRR
jgi:hypothetical protein